MDSFAAHSAPTVLTSHHSERIPPQSGDGRTVLAAPTTSDQPFSNRDPVRLPQTLATFASGRRRRDTCDPSLVQTHARSRPNLEYPGRCHSLVWRDSNRLRRHHCARLRREYTGPATQLLTATVGHKPEHRVCKPLEKVAAGHPQSRVHDSCLGPSPTCKTEVKAAARLPLIREIVQCGRSGAEPLLSYLLLCGSRSLTARSTAAPSIMVPQMRLIRPNPCVRIRAAAVTATQPQASRIMPSTSR